MVKRMGEQQHGDMRRFLYPQAPSSSNAVKTVMPQYKH